MKKYTLTIIGTLLIVIGFGMFCLGVSMFTYQGSSVSAFMSKAGEYSFSYWMPTIIIGILILVINKIIKSN